MGPQALTARVVELLASGKGSTGDLTVKPCAVGGNNRVFIVTTGGTTLIAKWYFSHPSDTRDRLKAEFSFLSYAAQIGIDCVPRPISCDPERNIGLYEFIDGSKLASSQITEHHIDQAITFFLRLNDLSCVLFAEGLPVASEGCFSIADHFLLIDGRIDRLAAINPRSRIDAEAADFVTILLASWQRLKTRIVGQAQKLGIGLDTKLPKEERCFSPSDFGFHNALLRPSGDICFIDFEYAGWDDPAKMAGDFFCHPAIPVNTVHFDRFVDVTMRFSRRADALIDRVRLLFPVFQTKWCCIILNDFLPDSARSRKFADPDFDEDERKRSQLDRAKRLFDSIQH